jgi:hypothetical protein
LAASTLPRPRKRNLWSAGTEEQLWTRIRDRDDRPISAVIREFCRERGLSFHTARAKYYRLQRTGQAAAEPPTDSALEDLGAFLRDASQVPGVDLVGFLSGLKTLAALAAAGQRRGELMEEVEILRRERAQAASRLEEYGKRLDLLTGELQTIAALVEEFTGLSSVAKVSGLGEFTRKLSNQVERAAQTAL